MEKSKRFVLLLYCGWKTKQATQTRPKLICLDNAGYHSDPRAAKQQLKRAMYSCQQRPTETSLMFTSLNHLLVLFSFRVSCRMANQKSQVSIYAIQYDIIRNVGC